MLKIFFRNHTKISLVIFISFIALEGCSTVNVIANQASKADDIYSKTVIALWWGGSDVVENVECRGNGLQFVSAKTNWLYSLVTVVTLGAVVPVEVKYRCTSVPLQDGGIIGMVEE